MTIYKTVSRIVELFLYNKEKRIDKQIIMKAEKLGRSIYISQLRNGSITLDEIKDDSFVFLSLHMEEEFDENYDRDIANLCSKLNEKGCKIIADISKRTLKKFDTDVSGLVKRLHLNKVRIDYGFSLQEIIDAARENSVVLNASTMDIDEILKVKEYGNVMAMHNFYPRKETGLDEDYFMEINRKLKENDIKVAAFIPGKIARGPLYEGLPTLEKQRHQSAYQNYVEMIQKYHIDEVYLSEPGIEKEDLEKIGLFEKEGVISLKAKIDPEYDNLYNTVFTMRKDSPSSLIRLLESREYSKGNDMRIAPYNNVERTRGSITIDNDLYKRYCGEMQITRKDFPKDEKVNVIGKIDDGYLDLLDMVERGNRFVLVK